MEYDESIDNAVIGYGEVVSELKLLATKRDRESVERYGELIEQLMVIDMALKPVKYVMRKEK